MDQFGTQPSYTACTSWSVGCCRAHASCLRQLTSDLRSVTCLQVVREFAPKKLWQDFRRLSLLTQARCALLAYFCAGTAGLYGYLRYSQVKRQREWAEVVRTWQ